MKVRFNSFVSSIYIADSTCTDLALKLPCFLGELWQFLTKKFCGNKHLNTLEDIMALAPSHTACYPASPLPWPISSLYPSACGNPIMPSCIVSEEAHTEAIPVHCTVVYYVCIHLLVLEIWALSLLFVSPILPFLSTLVAMETIISLV